MAGIEAMPFGVHLFSLMAKQQTQKNSNVEWLICINFRRWSPTMKRNKAKNLSGEKLCGQKFPDLRCIYTLIKGMQFVVATYSQFKFKFSNHISIFINAGSVKIPYILYFCPFILLDFFLFFWVTFNKGVIIDTVDGTVDNINGTVDRAQCTYQLHMAPDWVPSTYRYIPVHTLLVLSIFGIAWPLSQFLRKKHGIWDCLCVSVCYTVHVQHRTNMVPKLSLLFEMAPLILKSLRNCSRVGSYVRTHPSFAPHLGWTNFVLMVFSKEAQHLR